MFVIIIYKTLINFINNYCLNTNNLYIYIYMEPSKNITNYKQKYFKYKIKYLELKGGMSKPLVFYTPRNRRCNPTAFTAPTAPASTDPAPTAPAPAPTVPASTDSDPAPAPTSPDPAPPAPTTAPASKTTDNFISSSCELPTPPKTPTTSSTSSKPYIPPHLKPNHSKTPPIPPKTTDNSFERRKFRYTTSKQNPSEVSGNWRTDAPVCKELKKKKCNDTHGIYIYEYVYNNNFNIIITSHVLKHINSFDKKCIEDIDDETEKENLKNFVVSLVNDAISKGIYDEPDNKGSFTYDNKGRFTYDVNKENQYCIVGEWKKNNKGKNLYRVYTIYKCSGRYLTPDYGVY